MSHAIKVQCFKHGDAFEHDGIMSTWELSHIHMWQSRVEIEGYSVAYFDRIAAFEVRYR